MSILILFESKLHVTLEIGEAVDTAQVGDLVTRSVLRYLDIVRDEGTSAADFLFKALTDPIIITQEEVINSLDNITRLVRGPLHIKEAKEEITLTDFFVIFFSLLNLSKSESITVDDNLARIGPFPIKVVTSEIAEITDVLERICLNPLSLNALENITISEFLGHIFQTSRIFDVPEVTTVSDIVDLIEIVLSYDYEYMNLQYNNRSIRLGYRNGLHQFQYNNRFITTSYLNSPKVLQYNNRYIKAPSDIGRVA